MGALAPVSQWIPEDDLLLKNAIEAGASLEALAKGAVQFSRRFTVKELHDRWYSLLYDPVISAEASFHMIHVDCSATSKPKLANFKDKRHVSGKRKSDSVRNCYYAMRKRICNEPFDPMDLSFLLAPSNENCVDNGDDPLHGNGMLGDPTASDFQFEAVNLDIMHDAFPQMLTDGGIATIENGATHAFNDETLNPIEGEFCIGQDNLNNNFPHVLGEQMPLNEHCPDVDGLDDIKDLTVHGLFDADNVGGEPASTFEQLNSSQDNPCSDFGGKQIRSSPILDCAASFCNLEYSSPVPEMPIWRMVEGLSAPSMAVDDTLREKDLCTGDIVILPNDHDPMDTTSPGYGVLNADSKLVNEMQCGELKSPTACTDVFLEELSKSLFIFTNEEELLALESDGKDIIDNYGLNSLLNSPSDVEHDEMSNTTELDTSVNRDAHLTNPPGVCPGNLYKDGDPQSGVADENQNSEAQVLSSEAASNLRVPDFCVGPIICTLNTEDTEIPCNDHLPTVTSSSLPVPPPVPHKKLHAQRFVGRSPGLQQKESKESGLARVSSQLKRPQVQPRMGVTCPGSDFGVKLDLTDSNRKHVATSDAVQLVTPKEETTRFELAKCHGHRTNDSFVKKPSYGSDCPKTYTPSESEIDAPINQTLHKIGTLEPVMNPSISDEEEFESDDEIPNFSDIEAMILDMDLDPDDQDLFSSEEVLRYQQDEFKRMIIRLEQGAHSCMQRAIASHGAFAVLYGRHSKHYIKKPEILLGRDSDDYTVDIDLGREGRSNKISRRQAIIKMDKDGFFCVKNFGRCPIIVNEKEAGPGQSLPLDSGCLIEIRGLPFIFEINQTCVKQYLDCASKNTQTKEQQV